MKKEHILVTGGAGYLGSHICRALEESGYEPLIIDFNCLSKPFLCNHEHHNINIENDSNIQFHIKKYKIKTVIHLASYIEVGESVSNPLVYYENNVISSINFIKNVVSLGVKNIIFASSAAVYGQPDGKSLLTTDIVSNPVNPYGSTKKIMEMFLKDFCEVKGVKTVSLRLFNLSGANKEGDIGEFHNPETHIIPRIFRSLSVNRVFEIYGDDWNTPDGTCVRDYVHVDDAANAFIKSIGYLKKGGKSNVFNVGSGVGTSVMAIIKEVSRITTRGVEYDVKPRRIGDPAVLMADISETKKILQWEPINSSIENIISTAWKWHMHFIKNIEGK